MKQDDLVIVIEDYSGLDYHRVGTIIGKYNSEYIIQLHSNDSRIIMKHKSYIRLIRIEKESD